ncbi:uncharacterized protein B0H18DRAFT_1004486 [Fomitopsis serialis]|uniref:uncharacterized protein n=1 Tax=Fomitopsis serialis TaxID=139415 RepID=UPI002007F060|nr:uncharacterized protein B0H18DRAFT_1004486 [Neoantrodia serialis]KAH9926920.1 hypothetical protein B0H18DRAFT_1004486 [Neoantrodia serialis]
MAILPRIHNPYHHELLPSEIWMTFHSRTIPALFREIIVCFSAWESWLSGMSDDELDETRSSRAFAVVRVLEIEAYMQNGSGGVFENCCLIEAIQCLPNLERFLWMGCSPLPSLGVVDALAASCPRLRGLMLP